MRNIALASLIISFLALSSCTKVVPYYKPTIQQGNQITSAQVSQLRRGMSQEQVMDILGSPVIKPSFHTDELVYIETIKPARSPTTERRLILQFNNNRLISSNGDFKLPF